MVISRLNLGLWQGNHSCRKKSSALTEDFFIADDMPPLRRWVDVADGDGGVAVWAIESGL